MAAIEGENAAAPNVQQVPEGQLLLPVLGGENVSTTAGATGTSSTPRVSIEATTGIVRRTVRGLT